MLLEDQQLVSNSRQPRLTSNISKVNCNFTACDEETIFHIIFLQKVELPLHKWFSLHYGTTSGRAVLRSKLEERRCRVQFQSRFLILPFAVFCDFLRNSRKYGLGSIRKTPHGGHATNRPRFHKRTIGHKLTTKPSLLQIGTN